MRMAGETCSTTQMLPSVQMEYPLTYLERVGISDIILIINFLIISK